MANPSITNNGVTFTFQDGDVRSVDMQKKGHLDENPIPASDSDNAFVVDFNGVLKTITLNGAITEASSSRTSSGSVTTIEEQIDWLLALVDGAQTGYTFNSTYQTDKTVYCRNVKFTELSGESEIVEFVIELVEGI